ncbi:MAG: tRNA (guanosine(37)-N1)-methyltransferase TrmD [Gammaproteobacteria bacterium]|nr:tRNA (guanosine(37)-N1)-methyltransferase TrmD [Gammaproteobacteria bacterium]
MRIQIITLFPEMVLNLARYGVIGRALESGLVELHTLNPREFSTDLHGHVDDRPYGGGPGMVMCYEPLQKAIRKARGHEPNSRVVCLSAQGKLFGHEDVSRLRDYNNLVLVAGRYEGIDERLIEAETDEELAVGNFVVSGGELPAMLLIDALIRHVPGALGHEESARQDSFVDGMLDCPHYTRPGIVDSREVPEVLLQGDHQAIERWRKKQALGRTYLRRPDLFAKLELSEEQDDLLEEYLQEQKN